MTMPMPFEPDDETQAMIRQMVEDLEARTRKIGLYLEGVGVMSSPHEPEALQALTNVDQFKDAVKSGEAHVVIVATFTVGDIAWSKRVQDPEQEVIDDAAREILPDPVEELKEKMRRAKAEGRSIFDIDGEDDV